MKNTVIHATPDKFRMLFNALKAGGFCLGNVGDTITIHCIPAPKPVDVGKLFHLMRGCCDGSNIGKCYANRVAEQIEENKKENKKVATRVERFIKEPTERFTL